jgi:hypothetical protein
MHHADAEQNARRAWSESDLRDLQSLIAAGEPVRLIAERLGRSEYAVRSKAAQAKISLKPPGETANPRRPK